MSFPRYPAYKDSGVEWLGEVPAHWVVTSLKRGYEVVLGKMLQPEARTDTDELHPYLRAANIQPQGVDLTDVRTMWFSQNEQNQLLLKKNDLLVSEGGDVGRPAIWNSEGEYYFQNSINRVRARSSNHTKFLYYWILAIKAKGFIDVLCNKSTIAHFTAEKVAAVPTPFPVPSEQSTIVAFLDHETVRIDALIAEQQRLIELLKEKRQAVISHAVTKGLDPSVPMKDSGVEWLGEVPAHWCVSRLSHYAELLTGFPFPSASFSHDDSDTRLLRGANIGVGSLKWDDTVYWDLRDDQGLSRYLMRCGQIVLGMDRPWISSGTRVARVTKADTPCLLLQRVAAISPSSTLNSDYTYYLLSSSMFKSYLEPDLTGVSVPHISPEQILGYSITIPPVAEQLSITEFLKVELNKMDELFKGVRFSIGLLHERRSALISAAVTGKIDVRDWQPVDSSTTDEYLQAADQPASYA